MKKFFDNLMNFGVHYLDEPASGGGTAAPVIPETPGSETPPPEVPLETPKPDDVQAKPPEPPKPEEVFDWTKDERFERMWKKDTNQLYKSYKNLEKTYEPAKQELSQLKTQFDSLNKLAEEYGLTVEQLKEVFEEHKTLKDPASALNQRAGYLSEWVDNPLYTEKVMAFFQDLEKQEETRKYPNMNAEQVKKMREMETEISSIKADNTKRAQEQMKTKFSAEIKSNIAKAKKFSEVKGFDFTADIETKLIDHCDEQNIPTSLVYATFLDLYNEEIDKAHTSKVQNDQLKNLNKNNKDGQILQPGSKAGGTGVASDIVQRLTDKLEKNE